MRIGVLTGGGDCPGLNAVIRAVVRKGIGMYGYEFIGCRDGWKGPLENLTGPLGIPDVRAGLAGGANVMLIPEQPFSIEKVCAYVESRFQSHYAPIIVAAEGAVPDGGENVHLDKGLDAFGHVRLGGIGEWLASEIEKRTGK